MTDQNERDADGSQFELDLETWQSGDHEINERTSLPDGEHVELSCIWGVEFYGPSHVDALTKSLEALASGARQLSFDRDPVAWLRDLSSSRVNQAMLNLGILSTPGSDDILGSPQIDVTLPLEIEYAQAYLYVLSPSLIAVIVCFCHR